MPKIYIGRHWFNPETAHKWTDWPRKERLYMAIDQSDPELRWIRQPITASIVHIAVDISPAPAKPI